VTATPHLDRLERAFQSASPLFRQVVGRLRTALGPRWAAACDEAVARLFPEDAALAAAVAGYGRFVMEVLRAEARFEKARAYPQKSYAQASAEVYSNDAYMRGQYLPGLLLSHYLWPHHWRQACFFTDVFLDEVARGGGGGGGRLIDVGIGTGFYSRLAVAGVPGLAVEGYDVSRSSCDFAAWHVAAFGGAGRYQVRLQDVLQAPPEPARWLVSVEVLEHLEAPVDFLRGLRRLLAPGGRGFITAALNAPHADHIYLYASADQVLAQLDEAGFRVVQYLGARAEKEVKAGVPVAEVAAFIVA
jgi:2-polyprenyl-3-methyl-5-hydroxy-6-metoxy-1,4-benzoquinol methylase